MSLAAAAHLFLLMFGVPVRKRLVCFAHSGHQGQEPATDGYDAAYDGQRKIKRFRLGFPLAELGRQDVPPLL